MLGNEKPSKEAGKLEAMIQAAMDDQEITTTEYEKIVTFAQKDRSVDPQEERLLAELEEMIESGMVKRVPG